MIPQLVPSSDGEALCVFANKWGIDLELAKRLVIMQDHVPYGLRIISGHRTEEEEAALKAEGRPTAPPGRSTHTSCPATGADLDPTIAVTSAVKASYGQAAVWAGLRWGGGSPVDSGGIPSDWRHVDLGPRQS